MCYTILCAVSYGTFLKLCTWLEGTQKRTQTLATFDAPKHINAIIIILQQDSQNSYPIFGQIYKTQFLWYSSQFMHLT